MNQTVPSAEFVRLAAADPAEPDHKAAQDLTTGDFLAAGELAAGKPTEVLHVQTYPGVCGQETVILHRPVGQTSVLPFTADAEHRIRLATSAEVEAAGEVGERAELIANARALLDWLEANPDVPHPYQFRDQSYGLSGAEGVAKVRELAEHFGRTVRDDMDDRTQFEMQFGDNAVYTVVAWHHDGRPAEPERDVVAEDAERLGLLYTRADDEGDEPTGECVGRDMDCGRPLPCPDHPTAGLALTERAHEVLAVAPVSPARVPMHIGVVDDEDDL